MLQSWLYKEYRGHRIECFVLAAVLAIFLSITIERNWDKGITGSFFETLHFSYNTYGLAGIAMLARFLFVDEFRSDTRKFFDALPIKRNQVIVLKLGLLFSLVLLFSSVTILGVTFFAKDRENITQEFFWMLLVRFNIYALSMASLSFFLSVWGKYRIVVWMFFLLVTCIEDFNPSLYDFIHSLPVFQVVEKVAYERELWPVDAIIGSMFSILLMVLIGFAVISYKNSAWVYQLHKRMNPKELVITILLSFTVFLFLDKTNGEGSPETVSTLGMIRYEDSGYQFYLSRLDLLSDADEDTEIFSQFSQEILAKLIYLGVSPEKCPDIILVERSRVPDSLTVSAELLEGKQQLLLFADYKHREFQFSDLIYHTLAKCIETHSKGRSRLRRESIWITQGLIESIIAKNCSEDWRRKKEKEAIELYENYQKKNISIESMLELSIENKPLDDLRENLRAFHYLCFKEIIDKSGERAALDFAKETILVSPKQENYWVNLQEFIHPIEESLTKTWGRDKADFLDHLNKHFANLQSERNAVE